MPPQPQEVKHELALRVAGIFRVLSDPARLRAVAALAEREMCVHELARHLGMSQPAVSHHLRILRDMQLVRYRRAGRHAFYRLDDEHVRRLLHEALTHASHQSQAEEMPA